MSWVRKSLLLTMAVLVGTLPAAGQEPATLTGTITTPSGIPIEAANVFVESLSIGALTNVQGRYTIIVPESERARSPAVDVTASLIGYATVTKSVTLEPGTQVLDFVLDEDPLRITGITVVALGMERQSKELGIATQTLYGEELTRLEPNFLNTLAGRIAGVNVTNAGTQGGSSTILIRGESSISPDPMDNQPLFVVDGIPINNSAVSGGYDAGNAAQDIIPEDIESITVLKGPNAAALYGSRAANGVILVETKRGRTARGGLEITASQQVTFEDELKLPNYQNSYGQGYSGQFAFYDGNGLGLNDEVDESWGPPLDWDPDGDGEVLMIPQWFSAYDESLPGCVPNSSLLDERIRCRVADPWVSHPHNVDDFFRTGATSTTNVSVAASTQSADIRASFSNLYQEGMAPGHVQRRKSVSLAGGLKVSDRLSIDASTRYIQSGGENRPGVGGNYDTNAMTGLFWFGRQIDTKRLEDLYDVTRPPDEPGIGGYPYSWNTLYWLNPYFHQLVDRNEDTRRRLIGNISATYAVTGSLTVMGRIGTDWMQFDQLQAFAATPQTTARGLLISPSGTFWNRTFHDHETNADLLITADPQTGLPFTSRFVFGGNRSDIASRADVVYVPSLATPGTFDVANAAQPPELQSPRSRKRVNSLYGQAEFGYHDYAFLSLTGRNDWSSTLPESNRSYFYPSVSGSFVFTQVTDALPLSYGKLRVSWAEVGHDTEPYSLLDTYDPSRVWDGIRTFSLPNGLANADLKPETTESWEFGAEVGLLNNRLGLDVTYYTEETRNQIMGIPLSGATGRTSRLINAGTVENKGWEVLVRGTPLLSRSLRWESTLTWSRNWNRVRSLARGVTAIQLWATVEHVRLYAREGEPLGQLVADFDYRYEELTGEPIVGANGLPLVTAEPAVIGNVNPDWRAGWSNEITYGDVQLGFLFDWSQGGEVYSVTKAWGRYTGVLAETAEGGRCSPDGTPLPGYPVCDADTGVVFPGVRETSPGSGVFVRNTTPVSQQDLWERGYFIPRTNLEDATYIKLRELTLTYRIPGNLSSRWGVDAVDLALVGRNVWLWTRADHIDPETLISGTARRGFEYGQTPSARSFGFNVTVHM